MKKTQALTAIAMSMLLFSACKKENELSKVQGVVSTSLQDMISEHGANPDEAIFAANAAGTGGGHLYTQSNAAEQNTIWVFSQSADGMLTKQQEVNSGGAGYGAGLGSQGALILNETHSLLFAVNAGDNTVSSFSVAADGNLTLKHTAASGGAKPNSVAVHGNILYVLNTGSSSICGFAIGSDGELTKIEGSWHALSDTAVDAPQISFEPTGQALYVTEKATNKIDRFTLNPNGAVASADFMPSTGETPFGFDYARNKKFLVVSNAVMGLADAGSCTSYSLSANGMLNDRNGAVANNQGAPCWVGTTKHGTFAYVANTGNGTLSSYYISETGNLYLINAAAGAAGLSTIDVIVSSDNRYTYAIGAASHTLEGFERKPFGQLNHIGTVSSLPDFAAGLAVY
ncbi:lactonase family protein [Panacibacter ginsenosidivorans]|uniref:Lactonase family protein n=1 Tax=Panacibacter ginsenosidivorans TaxID=1813871 RepID=A0A5B8VD24_9BACT|nr:beta-propeller fold lactonase family protein [Panacibacter ginsenosidivorans]QEC68893.1 lactonase family protein [Panacibacter ginsenosidivorans]